MVVAQFARLFCETPELFRFVPGGLGRPTVLLGIRTAVAAVLRGRWAIYGRAGGLTRIPQSSSVPIPSLERCSETDIKMLVVGRRPALGAWRRPA
jgi:hypothetical protein